MQIFFSSIFGSLCGVDSTFEAHTPEGCCTHLATIQRIRPCLRAKRRRTSQLTPGWGPPENEETKNELKGKRKKLPAEPAIKQAITRARERDPIHPLHKSLDKVVVKAQPTPINTHPNQIDRPRAPPCPPAARRARRWRRTRTRRRARAWRWRSSRRVASGAWSWRTSASPAWRARRWATPRATATPPATATSAAAARATPRWCACTTTPRPAPTPSSSTSSGPSTTPPRSTDRATTSGRSTGRASTTTRRSRRSWRGSRWSRSRRNGRTPSSPRSCRRGASTRPRTTTSSTSRRAASPPRRDAATPSAATGEGSHCMHRVTGDWKYRVVICVCSGSTQTYGCLSVLE